MSRGRSFLAVNVWCNYPFYGLQSLWGDLIFDISVSPHLDPACHRALPTCASLGSDRTLMLALDMGCLARLGRLQAQGSESGLSVPRQRWCDWTGSFVRKPPSRLSARSLPGSAKGPGSTSPQPPSDKGPSLHSKAFLYECSSAVSKLQEEGGRAGLSRAGPQDLTLSRYPGIISYFSRMAFYDLYEATHCPVLGRGTRPPHNGLFQGQSYLPYKLGTESNVCE